MIKDRRSKIKDSSRLEMLPQDLLGGVVVEVVEVAAGPSALLSRLSDHRCWMTLNIAINQTDREVSKIFIFSKEPDG